MSGPVVLLAAVAALAALVAVSLWFVRRRVRSGTPADSAVVAKNSADNSAADSATIVDNVSNIPAQSGTERLEAAAQATLSQDSHANLPSQVPTATTAQLGVRAFMQGDYQRAFALLEPAGNDGHLRAQILLSKMYYAGHGVEQDMRAYAYWLQRAADNGDKPSKAKLKKMASQQ